MEVRRRQGLKTNRPLSLLDQPLPAWACLLGWCSATVLFLVMVHLLGGASTDDSSESVYSTWAIAHGHLACAFATPPTDAQASYAPFTYIAPIYPLLSGGIAAVARIGSAVPFPSAGLGSHCATAIPAIYQWSLRSNALGSTVLIGSLVWIVLMFGAVAFLRVAGRGRCGWEPVTLLVLACLPPVWAAVQTNFHPEDLLAMGLSLAGMACALRHKWVWAGVLLAFAVLAQQYALLVAAPLLVVAPKKARPAFILGGAVAAAVIVVPLLKAASGVPNEVLRAITLGSGDSSGTGGTLLRQLHLQGWLLTGASRVAPVILAMLLAWWVAHRLGAAVLSPVPLTALIALSFSLRLALEENLRHTYYFMALAVALVLLDVARGHLRGVVLAWVTLVTLAYDTGAFLMWSPEIPDLGLREHAPIALAIVGLLIIATDVMRGRVRWYLLAWVSLVTYAFVAWPSMSGPFWWQFPILFWQLVLVASGVGLAAAPLLSQLYAGSLDRADRYDLAPSLVTGWT